MIHSNRASKSLKHTDLLFVCDNGALIREFETQFENTFKSVSIASNKRFMLEKLDLNSYGIIVIDSGIECGLEEITFELKNKTEHIPKIVLLEFYASKLDNELVLCTDSNIHAVLSKPFRYEDLILAMVLSLNQARKGDRIEFQNGIFYDKYKDNFYYKNLSLVEFTRLEKSLLKFLIERKGEVTEYEEIKEAVWKGKNMSIYTMRNMVNKIRQKTYYEIIKTYSNKGYIIDG